MTSSGRGSRWIEPNRPSVGLWAFTLHRLSGMALVLYLCLHLIVISQLYSGPERWDTFLKLAKSPFFTVFDVLLLGGVVFHGLNGVRLTLLSLGYVLRWQKKLFWLNLAVTFGLIIGYVLVLWGI